MAAQADMLVHRQGEKGEDAACRTRGMQELLGELSSLSSHHGSDSRGSCLMRVFIIRSNLKGEFLN